MFRAGTSVAVTRRISASIAWRMEGVPRYDLIGRSDGFRRPGVEMYWEPGLTVMSGRHAVSFNMPIGYYFNRFRNPNTATRGDSTFPEYMTIATYSMRLGRASKAPTVTDQPVERPFPGAREEQD